MRKQRWNNGLVWSWVAIVVLIIDRFSKHWALAHLSLSESLRVLSVFNLTLAYNTGAAFSLLHQASGWQNVFLCTLAFLVSAVIFYKLATLPGKNACMAISFSLILGGALGNAWDRIEYGYVIDFLHFHLEDWHFAIFNVADSAICVGAVLLLWCWMVQKKVD